MNLEEMVKSVKEADGTAVKQALRRWDQVAKPLNSLGILEEDLVRIAGAQNSEAVCLDQKWIAVMCADNGIVEEGVTQTGQEVTAVVAANMARGASCVRYGRDGDFKPENTLWNPEFPERACHDAGGNGKSHGNRDGSGRDSKRKGLPAGRLR